MIWPFPLLYESVYEFVKGGMRFQLTTAAKPRVLIYFAINAFHILEQSPHRVARLQNIQAAMERGDRCHCSLSFLWVLRAQQDDSGVRL